jgi:hypothetical protein
MTTRQENEIRKIALLQEANVVYSYAIAKIEKELETIYEKQKLETGYLENTIAGYFKSEFGITNRIQFANESLYIYCLDSDFSHLTLKLDLDNKLSINWFSTTCNSENKNLLNYLSILGIIAGNMDKIELEFKIWIEEYEIINSLPKENNKLHRNAKNQISINLLEIAKLEKKIK